MAFLLAVVSRNMQPRPRRHNQRFARASSGVPALVRRDYRPAMIQIMMPARWSAATPTRALLTLALLAGCGDDPTAVDVRNVTFAPELGIDLGAMTRTPEGLYFLDVEPGAGTPAEPGRRLDVYYQGWLPNGTRFDARRPPADPFSFVLGAGMVIDGWDLGVEGMRPGGVRLLVIPPSLGYGDTPNGPIPANSVLVFEVERAP
jgi:hypothetical protein